jgi:serine/threonine protein kinase
VTQWARIRAALDELLLLPEGERLIRLHEVEQRDPELGRELATLLAHDQAAEQAKGFLAPAASNEPSRSMPPRRPGSAFKGLAGLGLLNLDAGTQDTGRRIGPYEVVRELGRGGMGIVYLARRADGAFERRVALKIIQREFTDDRLLERFRRERQVLANLEHPGIARLIEGGTTEAETPYLVMEYVEGVPIDAYCDAERLSVRARTVLFLAVCDAVQHAHEHLIVHRDLKPRNILVTTSGEPKLLDFGIAKVLDPEKTSAAPEVTTGVMQFMTPAYASPEQVAGRPITTATDVYSLGVVLYQLLTGVLPYKVDTTHALEIERIVTGTEAQRPSSSLQPIDEEVEARARARTSTARGLIRELSGDLDRVVLKALRKEPRQRYASVEKLADDLRRYLAGLPVSARADTFLYRSSKFVRRHRGAVAAAGIVLLALVSGLAISRIQYRKAERAEQVERDLRRLAEERLKEGERLARELGVEREAAQTRLVELERLNGALTTERALAERHFKDVHAFATKLIFDLHGALYPLEGTTQALKLVVDLGIQYLDKLAAEVGDDRGLKRELAHAYMRLSGVQGAAGPANLGHLEAALSSAEKALGLAESLFREAPEERGNRYTLALTLVGRANLLQSAGQVDVALAELRRAVEVSDAFADDPSANLGQMYVAYSCRAQIAVLLQPRDSLEQTLERQLNCEALLQRIAERHPQSPHGPELELVRVMIAGIEHALGRKDAALERVDRALASLEAMAEGRPLDYGIARKLRYARLQLSQMLGDSGEFSRAYELLESNGRELEALALLDPADFQTSQDQVDLARDQLRMLALQRNWRESVALAEGRLQLARALVRDQPLQASAGIALAEMLRHLGVAEGQLGMLLEAGQSLAEGRDILEGLLQREPSHLEARGDLVRTRLELARAHRAAGLTTGALPESARRSLDIAIGLFEHALAEMDELEQEGVRGLNLDPGPLRVELGACRSALAAILGG